MNPREMSTYAVVACLVEAGAQTFLEFGLLETYFIKFVEYDFGHTESFERDGHGNYLRVEISDDRAAEKQFSL